MSRVAAPAAWSAVSRSAAGTVAIGEALGRTAPDGALILLEGPLGAGKTTLAQGVGAGCGVTEFVTSPTYNLILHYRGDRDFTHADLYRLEDATQLASLDLDEVFGADGVTCVEWPALAEPHVDPPWARVRIAPQGRPDGPRRLDVAFAGAGWEPARAALAALAGELP